MSNDMNVFDVVDVKTKPDIYHEYPPNSSFSNNTPLIIDNGSYHCKVGWATDKEPRLLFKNVIAKLRGKKETEIQIGNDIPNIEVVRWLLKTQFDKNVVTHFDAQEQIFDYIFSHLGISSEGKVDHPVLLCEAPCNPNHTRHLMTELLFECYNIPKLAYGVDGLYSFNYNYPEQDGLIVSCGYQTTHVLPVIKKQIYSAQSRRINVGGAHITSFMHKLMQLKYPIHSAAVTISRAEDWIVKHCHIAKTYQEQLVKWSDIDYYCDTVHKLQLPFNVVTQNKSLVEAQKERKLQQVKRLKEINARRRAQRLAADEERLLHLQNMLVAVEENDESAANILNNLGFETSSELLVAIDEVSSRIERTKKKMNEIQSVSEEPKTKKVCKESQVSLFGSVQALVDDVRQKRQDILDARAKRKQRKADMAKRRTFASQQRMRIISQLAAEKKKVDDFGANDDDWQVYKVINKEGGDTDSEEEQEKIAECEQVLLEHDPEFKKEMEVEGLDASTAEYYQLHLDTEQIRVPELLFQPSMMGFEQAGIAETIDFVLRKFSHEEQNILTQNIFLTGGPALIPGFKDRLEKELLEMRPFQSKFNINIAANPEYDSWNGARVWTNNKDNLSKYFMTKSEYEEYGDGYFKPHQSSNIYSPTPIAKSCGGSNIQSKESKPVTPVIPVKRQVTPRTKQPRMSQLRKNSSSSL